jgi:psiF repeat
MRIIGALSAIALLGAATVMPGVPTAAAAQSPPQATVPKAPRTQASGTQTNTSPPGQPSLKGCNKQADARNLTGKDRATFVKDCEAGKTPPEA